ncbi:unnamed protein product [Symbiodinium microadriaticum]|nr:unnamed protein product [Symbiodinium microadriaticum]
MTVIVVTHGLTLRLFLMRWFHFTVEEFEISRNPPNAGYVCLNREPTGDVWYPHAFRISERGLSLCNFPNRTYDPEHGRRYLTELVAVDSPSARPLHTVDSKE